MCELDTKSSSEQIIRPKDEVIKFLEQAKNCLIEETTWTINNETWANGRVNKTQAFMAERNLKDEDVADVIKELQVSNYCYTVEDRNANYPNEFFWIFGITMVIVDSEEDLYIKLKIRKFEEDYLLVMSFHPEQTTSSEDALTFPYAS